jgi:hypothetical protein
VCKCFDLASMSRGRGAERGTHHGDGDREHLGERACERSQRELGRRPDRDAAGTLKSSALACKVERADKRVEEEVGVLCEMGEARHGEP